MLRLTGSKQITFLQCVSVQAFLNCSSLEMSNHTGACRLHFSGVYLFMLSQIADLLECLSHTGSKANGFSLLYIFLCFLKLQLSWNVLSHWSKQITVLWCVSVHAISNCSSIPMSLSHREQANGFFLLCILLCFLKLLLSRNVLSNRMQAKSFSPLCIFSCFTQGGLLYRDM